MTITPSRSCRHGQDGLLRYWQACLVDRSKDEWDCQQYRPCQLLVSRLAVAPGMALTGEDKRVFCHWPVPHFPFFQPVTCPALSKALVISPQASKSTQNGMKTHSTLKKTRYNHR